MALDLLLPSIRRDQRMFWIHAGPHKAASSYIKERLRQNRDPLAAQGVLLDGEHNHLAKAVRLGDHQVLEQQLSCLPQGVHRILLSSSSLDTQLLKSDVLEKLQTLCGRYGFSLGVSYVIREQHSWINSIYCHRVRRFRVTPTFPQYCESIMRDSEGWDIDYVSKFQRLEQTPGLTRLFLPLSRQVTTPDPFLALVSALDLDQPDGPDGWQEGRPTKDNIQPGTRGIWMSSLCRDLVAKCGVNPAALRGVGKVIRDIAIERSWDRETFNGFDQSLLNRLNTFYADSNELFAQRHWGVSWKQLFPERPAAQRVYLGPASDSERQEMRQLMVLALRRLGFPLRRRRRFFKLYDAAVCG